MTGSSQIWVSADLLRPGEFPADMRMWFPPGRLLALTNEVAGLMARDPAFPNRNFEKFSTETLLSLLTFSYVAGSFGSEDIEWEILNDPLLGNFCGSPSPDAPAIRRFRRAYRPWLLQSLVCLSKMVLAEHPENGGAHWTDAKVVEWASRKIQLAILMDASAAD